MQVFKWAALTDQELPNDHDEKASDDEDHNHEGNYD